MKNPNLILKIVFYQSKNNNEPVRDWLKSLPREEMKQIGTEIKTVQFGWPLGMPLVRKMEANLWEVRVKLDNRMARILFTIKDDLMILLHGFIKKSQKTPKNELLIAQKRLANLQS
jgi:phage-related protein